MKKRAGRPLPYLDIKIRDLTKPLGEIRDPLN